MFLLYAQRSRLTYAGQRPTLSIGAEKHPLRSTPNLPTPPFGPVPIYGLSRSTRRWKWKCCLRDATPREDEPSAGNVLRGPTTCMVEREVGNICSRTSSYGLPVFSGSLRSFSLTSGMQNIWNWQQNIVGYRVRYPKGRSTAQGQTVVSSPLRVVTRLRRVPMVHSRDTHGQRTIHNFQR